MSQNNNNNKKSEWKKAIKKCLPNSEETQNSLPSKSQAKNEGK